MNIYLPYEIGTILTRVENGTRYLDKIDHYIIGNKIEVVLILCYNIAPRLSIPINIDKILKEWEV